MADYATSPLPVTGSLNIADPGTGFRAAVSLTGQLQVQTDAFPLLNDFFEGGAIDTTNRWNTPVLAGSGTVTQSSTAGLVFTVSTTASNGGALSSQPTFFTQTANPIAFGTGIKIEATTIATGNHRFFGMGLPGTAYSTTNPISDGIGFEITTAGVLRAVVYASDVAIFAQNLTIPVDGLEHVYFISTRANFIQWFVDNVNIPVMTTTTLAVTPNITLLPFRMHSLNAGSTTVGTPTITAYGAAILDNSSTSIQFSDGTYGWRKATVSTTGAVKTIEHEKTAKTYSCSAQIAAAAAATDIAILPGNATNTVYVTKVTISGVQTTGGVNDVQLVKRSTANSGGTSTGMTVVPHDSSDGAASSLPLSYTANPTPGTAVGSVRRGYIPLPAATGIVNPIVEFNFGALGRPITLRGVAQGLAVNLNGATITGGTFDVNYEWYEI